MNADYDAGQSLQIRQVSPEEAEGRLDSFLVHSGLARSRGHARELLDCGHVTVDDAPVHRPATPVVAGAVVAARTDRWVGRAAHKLLAALSTFSATPDPPRLEQPLSDSRIPTLGPLQGRRALDLGASTGGFTQVLLERQVASVVALDVGHGQLAAQIANDPRVFERSRTNVRDLKPGDYGPGFDIIVGDLSFISLRLVVPVVAEQLAPHGDAIMLVKPQFEVGRGQLGKGGIVRSSRARRQALTDVLMAAAAVGLVAQRLAVSPLPGGNGNIEYLLWWRHGSDQDRLPGPTQVSALIDTLCGEPGYGEPTSR